MRSVKETLRQVEGEADFEWRLVDIDGDAELRQKYNDEVPVVFIDGRKAFKYQWARVRSCECWRAERGPVGRSRKLDSRTCIWCVAIPFMTR